MRKNNKIIQTLIFAIFAMVIFCANEAQAANLKVNQSATAVENNPIDDARFFVRQQYLDFLNREPDAAGWDFWTSQITSCGNDAACIAARRTLVSEAFFFSIEFEASGYFITLFYIESFGRLPNKTEFLADVERVNSGVIVGQQGWEAVYEANKQQFANEWTQRPDFRAIFDGLSNADYVNAIFANGGAPPGEESNLRAMLIAGLSSNPPSETRATVLRKAGESQTIYNRQFNRAIVNMLYIGYLRREPDAQEFNYWLARLDNFSLPNEDVRDQSVAVARLRTAEAIDTFVKSVNYRGRFSPTATSVSIGGRVTTFKGRGIARAQVRLTNPSGETRTAFTNSFGYFRFNEVSAGETCIFEVKSKRYQFANNPTVLFITEELDELNFEAMPYNYWLFSKD